MSSPELTPMEKFRRALKTLAEEADKEVSEKQAVYGDAWYTVEIDTMCHILKNDANRLPMTKDPTILKHRLVDLVSYCAFAWVKLEGSK